MSHGQDSTFHTPAHLLELQQALQMAMLKAVVQSQDWDEGQIAFQGGTALETCYGSPRRSEDLDFLVDRALDMTGLDERVHTRLAADGWGHRDLRLRRAKLDRNPHAFVLTLPRACVETAASLHVKVDMWRAPREAIQAIAISTKAIYPDGRTLVPTQDMREIYIDKIFAFAARPFLKPRDVFDLHWIGGRLGGKVTADDMQRRLALYPNQEIWDWVTRAQLRQGEVGQAESVVTRDLKRWLPPDWSPAPRQIKDMIEAANAALGLGLTAMYQVIERIEMDHPDAPSLPASVRADMRNEDTPSP